MVFSLDGRALVSGSEDRTIKVWNASLGLPAQTWRGHLQGLSALAFSSDARFLATGGHDKTAKLWSFPAGQEILTLRGHTACVSGVAFSPDRRCLATASWDQTVRIWDTVTANQLKVISGDVGNVTCVVYSHSGQTLAWAGNQGEIVLWDTQLRAVRTRLVAHRKGVMALAFSPDDCKLASAGSDHQVIVWDLASGQHHVLNGHTDFVSAVAYSPDGERLASAGGDGKVLVWDTATRQQLLCLDGHGCSVRSIAYSPDGQLIASGGQDGKVKVWDGRHRDEQLADQRQAIALLDHLSQNRTSDRELADSIRKVALVGDAVRREALELATPYRRGITHRLADALIQTLGAEQNLPKSAIVERVQRNSELSDSVRCEALVLAERYVGQPAVLGALSWATVRQQGAKPAQYAVALQRAEEAVQLEPANAALHVTLGIAYYRSGQYQNAANELAQSADASLRVFSDQEAARLAFLAMAKHRLGDIAGYKELLRRLNQPGACPGAEAHGFLLEAVSLASDTAKQ
jgi:hypothetical protein